METFHWPRCPEGEKFVEQVLEKACLANKALNKLKEDLLEGTSSRLLDWVDHIVVGCHEEDLVKSAGYQLNHAFHDYRLFSHPLAQLPKIVLKDSKEPFYGVAVTVDRLEDFFLSKGVKAVLEGSPLASFRRALVSQEEGCTFWVVERKEEVGVEPQELSEREIVQRIKAKELWALRPRHLDDEQETFKIAFEIVENMVALVGEGVAATLLLEVERAYWQGRNHAAQIQKNRQDKLGMGWANHDHHTFRSSRKHFYELVRLFEVVGFRTRERFYAGEEAGWGAQVMEHPKVRLVLFLDVDLLPEELAFDFAHIPLPQTKKLGTIGLWCALHGDSILQSGMHHLEAQFMFDNLKDSLHKAGVRMMSPFSDFTYLKQAFTEGEIWLCDRKRIDLLFKSGLITEVQKTHFLEKGALGSHLENLQRREGYKGFNQKNVSFIIKKTDPRNF